MLTIRDTDLAQLDDFQLRWRWTDPKYNLLTPDELNRIRPLRHEKALEFDAFARSVFGAVPFRVTGSAGSALRSLAAAAAAASCDSSGDPAVGRNWLQQTLPALDQDIVVSWYGDTAVLTRSTLFARYWDDFCYPSSDDVAVIPLTFDWMLYFWHEEMLYFLRRHGYVPLQVAGPGVAPGGPSL